MLSFKQRQLILILNSYLPRILDCLLRLFLSCADKAGWGCSNVKYRKRFMRLKTDCQDQMVKWVRVKRCSSANTLNEKLCVFSGKLDESINQVENSSQMSKKKDNVHILIVCWLYCVNGGLAHSVCCLVLDKHVTVIQEPILLM